MAYQPLYMAQQDAANARMNELLREEQNRPFLGSAPAQGTNPIPDYLGGRAFGGGLGVAVPPYLQEQYGKLYATNRYTPENQGLLSQMGVSPEMITQAQTAQTQKPQPMDLATTQKAAYNDGLSMVQAGQMGMEEFNKVYTARFGKDALDEIWGVKKKYESTTKEDLLDVYGQKEQQKADIANNKLKTKQELKIEAAKPKQKATLNAVNLTTDTLLKSVNELLTMKGADSIYGLVGGYTPNIRKQARDAQAKLNSIVSQLGVRALNDMRAASQTGGAVGQVTEKEWPILQSQIASLERAQSWESAQKAMEDIIFTVKTIKKFAQEGYSDVYGEVGDSTNPDQKAPAMGVIPQGRVKVQSADGKIGHIPESQLQDALNQGFKQVQ